MDRIRIKYKIFLTKIVKKINEQNNFTLKIKRAEKVTCIYVSLELSNQADWPDPSSKIAKKRLGQSIYFLGHIFSSPIKSKTH